MLQKRRKKKVLVLQVFLLLRKLGGIPWAQGTFIQSDGETKVFSVGIIGGDDPFLCGCPVDSTSTTRVSAHRAALVAPLHSDWHFSYLATCTIVRWRRFTPGSWSSTNVGNS